MAKSTINSTTTTIIDLISNDENYFANIEWFDDQFDILNDEDSNEDLENIMEEYNEDFDFDHLNTFNLNAEEMFVTEDMITTNDYGHQVVQEQILSQKLSQLSTKDKYPNEQQRDEDYDTVRNNKRSLSTPSSPEMVLKKMREWNEIDNEKKEDHQMSDYFERLNDMFDKIMMNHMIKNRIILSIDDLRQLAILKHRIAMIELDKKLWMFYLKLGTGQCTTSENNKTKVDRNIWPMAVKKLCPPTPNTVPINKEQNKQNSYEMTVHQHLEELNEKLELYFMEYYEKKNDLINFTDEMEQIIETFVYQYSIVPFEMKLNYNIKTLEYNYDDQLLENEYLQQKPTENQKRITKRLYQLRYAYIEAKQGFIQLKQLILHNKPTQFIHSKALSIRSTMMSNSTPDASIFQQQIDQEEKELQQKMTDLMAEYIGKAENKILEYRNLFHKEIDRISMYDKDTSEGFSTELMNLIHRRINIMNKKLEYCFDFKHNYYLRHRYADVQDALAISSVCFSPTMIIGTPAHLLTPEQLKLLNRGPTYVPLCQMYVSSASVSIQEIIEKQYKSLQHDLNILFTKCNVNMVSSMSIKNDIKKLLIKVFSISLPQSFRERAIYEKQLVQSIREEFKRYDLILRRTADQRNVFYLGSRNEFEEKINEYMKTTDIFELCENIDEQNLQATRNNLITKMKSMNERLEMIFSGKQYKDILKKLYITIDKVQLPYLYFLPDVSQENHLLVQPIVVTKHSATAQLAYFLDQLLRPIVQRQLESTTFQNGADFIRNMANHDTMLLMFQDFLMNSCLLPTIQNFSKGKIFQLTTLFLRNNWFYYDHKIYRFVNGSPTSFPFTETLANIYILSWLKSLFRHQILEKEFYGRCKNQLFLTWNKTKPEFFHLIKMIGNQQTDILLNIKIDSNVQFLHAYIENQNGILYSRTYYDSNIQKYTLPYVIGNSKVAHSHWLRSSLIQAVRYCTSVYDFNQERIYLETTCLANGYSLEFIEKRINHFYQHFDAISLRSILDQQVYKKLRHRLFNFIGEQKRILNRNRELKQKDQYFRLSYLYEYGPKHKFNKELQEILSTGLNPSNTSAKINKINIRLTTKLHHSLNALLSQQKPSHPILSEKTL
ncbi:unnamed protein product [Rotaria sordida]|uniref:Helix-turn-helix domain-containing protein n=1 Tax=Rotaria sordida TaxID=392033 RepID=A0A819JTG0_9BILA|nr:unnamed protein product [Rotaria sordida]CAF3934835.1 unnamed protein product [Rotaria sordida]